MTLTSTGLVLPLDEVGSADAPRVGHKAATLAISSGLGSRCTTAWSSLPRHWR